MQEIGIINPEIIVCCNTFTEFIWIYDIEEVKTRLSIPERAFDDPFSIDAMKIVNWPYHPAARGSHKERYEEMRDKISGKI